METLECAGLLAYFFLFFYYLGRSFKQLHARNYRCARTANITLPLGFPCC